MKKIPLLILSVLILTTLSACNQNTESTISKNQENKINIVTTFPPIYSFVRNVAGEKAQIENLVPAGTSIHTWEPKPSDIRKLNEADIIFKNGLELEVFLDKIIESIDSNVKIVQTSKGIKTLDNQKHKDLDKHSDKEHKHNDHDHGEEHHDEHKDEDHDDHHHGEKDPHIWLSLDLVPNQIENIKNALIEIDPQNKDLYEKNANTYTQEIENLKENFENDFNKIDPKNYLVFHDAYQYFQKDFGLDIYNKGAIEPFPGKEPSISYIKKLTELIQNEEVNIVFTEPQFSPKIVDTLREELGVKTYEIDPIGNEVSKDGYIANMKNLTNTFIKAFNE